MQSDKCEEKFLLATLQKCQYWFILTLTKVCLVCSISLKVSVLFDMNSDNECVVLFCINSLNVSELFHVTSKIIQLLFSKTCILV